MAIRLPPDVSQQALAGIILALADDELVLGHRDSEWTGHSPILEEDIAFSNIAQDELGHALAWYTLHAEITGRPPDAMVFQRKWQEFTCCRFVTYPKGDFAYAVVRQFFFDAAEDVRMKSFERSSFVPMKQVAEKIQAEESYHLLHSQGLVERLGDATEESHRRMQEALESAFPQALGMFEKFWEEERLVGSGVIVESRRLQEEWMNMVIPVMDKAMLKVPAERARVPADTGGRSGKHSDHFRQLVDDLQLVYQMAPSGRW